MVVELVLRRFGDMVRGFGFGVSCGNGGGMGFLFIDFVYPIPQPLCTFDLSPLYTKLYVTHLFSPIKLHECSTPPAWKVMI